jgi:hypothetical protein
MTPRYWLHRRSWRLEHNQCHGLFNLVVLRNNSSSLLKPAEESNLQSSTSPKLDRVIIEPSHALGRPPPRAAYSGWFAMCSAEHARHTRGHPELVPLRRCCLQLRKTTPGKRDKFLRNAEERPRTGSVWQNPRSCRPQQRAFDLCLRLGMHGRQALDSPDQRLLKRTVFEGQGHNFLL